MVGVTYGWSDLTTNSSLMVYQSGTYWVNVMQNGCNYSDTIVINYNNNINLDLGNDTSLCAGSDYLIDISALGGTFLWQDLSTGPTYLVTQPDTISVQVNDGTCTYIDSLIVDYYLPNTDFLGNDTLLCVNSTLLLDVTSPIATATYLWQDLSVLPTYLATQPDTLWVDLNDGSCTYRDSIIITYGTAVSSNILGADTLICIGDSITIIPQDFGMSYLWSDNSIDSILTVFAPGAVWLNLTDNGCTFSDTVVIGNYTPININLGNDISLCEGNNVNYTLPYIGVDYQWSDLSTSNAIMIDSSSTVWVNIFENGCTYTDTIVITVNDLPIVNIGDSLTFCEGASLDLDAQNIGSAYQWQNLSVNQTFTVIASGTYWVDVFDSNGCTASDTAVVTEIIIDVNLGNDTILCVEDQLILTVSPQPGATYLWQDFSVLNTFIVSNIGNYFVEVSLSGCINTDTVNVDYIFLDAIYSIDSILCLGDEVSPENLSTITPNDLITSVFWDFGDNSFSSDYSPTHIYRGASTFDVSLVIVSSLGCIDSVNISNVIDVYNLPIANFEFSPDEINELTPQVDFNNLSSNSVEWEWNFDNLGMSTKKNPSFDFSDNLNKDVKVTLVATSEYGCKHSITQLIKFDAPLLFYVPNAFTPGGTGLNSEFLPILSNGFNPYAYHLLVYNRWGDVVFESYNHTIGWDGTYDGKEAQTDVYIWTINFEDDKREKEHLQKGYVTLLR